MVDVSAFPALGIARICGAVVAVVAEGRTAHTDSSQALIEGRAEFAVVTFKSLLGWLMSAPGSGVARIVGTLNQIVTVLDGPPSANTFTGAEISGSAGVAIVAWKGSDTLVLANAVEAATILGADVHVVTLVVGLASGRRGGVTAMPETICGAILKDFKALHSLAARAGSKETRENQPF